MYSDNLNALLYFCVIYLFLIFQKYIFVRTLSDILNHIALVAGPLRKLLSLRLPLVTIQKQSLRGFSTKTVKIIFKRSYPCLIFKVGHFTSPKSTFLDVIVYHSGSKEKFCPPHHSQITAISEKPYRRPVHLLTGFR